jgi:hypothetical protein
VVTLEEHILDELDGRNHGLDMLTIKLEMQDRVHALSSDTEAAVIRLGLAGKIGQVPSGKWKLAHYCSPDLFCKLRR